ncbi:MAG TPA: DUF547 domain-containing protein [Gammaproteobacteria bacterium]|nr:DUF547 domain-containing protein [Gammaproteobacteria bacterium]
MKTLLFLLTCALTAPLAAAEPDWRAYADVLQRHVKPGRIHGVDLKVVNYTALKADPDWHRTVAALAAFDPATLVNRQERLAFYINAYNILAIKTVVDNWPLTSIKDAGGWLQPVWQRPAGSVGGHTVTLHHIEHEVLRPMGEPRIHMAIVCASVSCPDLRPEPYRGAQLDRQLDEQTRAFLNNPQKGLRHQGGDVHLSRLFDWFEDDFQARGGVAAFVRRHRPGLPAAFDYDADLPYDWALNGH